MSKQSKFIFTAIVVLLFAGTAQAERQSKYPYSIDVSRRSCEHLPSKMLDMGDHKVKSPLYEDFIAGDCVVIKRGSELMVPNKFKSGETIGLSCGDNASSTYSVTGPFVQVMALATTTKACEEYLKRFIRD